MAAGVYGRRNLKTSRRSCPCCYFLKTVLRHTKHRSYVSLSFEGDVCVCMFWGFVNLTVQYDPKVGQVGEGEGEGEGEEP